MLIGTNETRLRPEVAPVNAVVAYLLSQGNTSVAEIADCNRASSLLFLLLMFGTVWVGVSLYNFNKTYNAIINKYIQYTAYSRMIS